MSRNERVVMYGLAAAALMSVAAQGLTRAWAASPAPAPEPAKIATCDVYELVQRVVEGSSYELARNAEQERVRTALKPLETRIEALILETRASKGDSATDPKLKELNDRRTEYTKITDAESATYSKLVCSQFVEAYKAVAAEASRVAQGRGFDYVVTHKLGEMTPHTFQALVEDFVSRPMLVTPKGVDITEAVRTTMKLPAEAKKDPAAPAGAGPQDKPAPEPKK